MKNLFGIGAILVIILSVFTFVSFYNSVKVQAYNFVPSSYNQQWQKAMDWVRTDTPEDAVFAHWWDYGYWLQSIGERATVTDGGNAITYWNYLMGRHVLTGDNQKDALEFLYNHDVDYFLIDSSDIGKYGAFSIIGSDENFDRYSFVPVMGSDPKQSTETSDGFQRVYVGQTGLDEDIVYDLNGSQIFLPGGKTAILGIIINFKQIENETEFKQPEVAFYYQGQQYRLPLRYVEYKGQFMDFGSGLEGAAKIIQSFQQNDGSLSVDEMGGLIYISPRVFRGYLAQKYLLDDPLNQFGQFEVAHIESSLFVRSLRSSGISAEEFVIYYGRLQGPITIWKVNYLGNEEFKEEYTDIDSTKYLSWQL